MKPYDRVTCLLYLLMRDSLPTGEVARLVKETEWVPPHKDCQCGKCVDPPTVYTAKGLETYARELASRVMGSEATVDQLLDLLGSPSQPCSHVKFRPRCVSCFNRRLEDAEEKIRTALKGDPIGFGHITHAEVNGERGAMTKATVTVKTGDKEYEFAVPPAFGVANMHEVLGRRVALVVLTSEEGSSEEDSECEDCEGTGEKVNAQGDGYSGHKDCDVCGGTGKLAPCARCGGPRENNHSRSCDRCL